MKTKIAKSGFGAIGSFCSASFLLVLFLSVGCETGDGGSADMAPNADPIGPGTSGTFYVDMTLLRSASCMVVEGQDCNVRVEEGIEEGQKELPTYFQNFRWRIERGWPDNEEGSLPLVVHADRMCNSYTRGCLTPGLPPGLVTLDYHGVQREESPLSSFEIELDAEDSAQLTHDGATPLASGLIRIFGYITADKEGQMLWGLNRPGVPDAFLQDCTGFMDGGIGARTSKATVTSTSIEDTGTCRLIQNYGTRHGNQFIGSTQFYPGLPDYFTWESSDSIRFGEDCRDFCGGGE